MEGLRSFAAEAEAEAEAVAVAEAAGVEESAVAAGEGQGGAVQARPRLQSAWLQSLIVKRI